jgi:hypothetical protein
MLYFFRTDSFQLSVIEYKWQSLVSKLPFLYRLNGKVVMVADGVKKSKEGRYMPGVKKLHQESGNSAKGEYIYGHMFGGIGALVGNPNRKMYCVLVSLRIHDGLKTIRSWLNGEDFVEESHVVKTIRDAQKASMVFGESFLLLDRLYLTVPMLKALSEVPLVQAVTKAKINAKAFYLPPPKKGRGAPRKKGEKVKVAELFQTLSTSFVKDEAFLYGKKQEVSYHSIDLLWGDAWYQKLRFVLVNYNGAKSILVSTDLSLKPREIMELYGFRFKIECSFREFNQVISGFNYRFWTHGMTRLQRYKSNDYNQELQKNIVCEDDRRNVLACLRAIECHALLGCIALGLLQIASIQFSSQFTGSAIRFMRTPSNNVPSEATVADFMRKNIYQLFRFLPNISITAIIFNHQALPSEHVYDLIA